MLSTFPPTPPRPSSCGFFWHATLRIPNLNIESHKVNISSNQYRIPLFTFIPRLKKIIYTKGHTLFRQKVPVNLVVLSGLLPSSWRSYTDPTSNVFSYFRITIYKFKMSSKHLLSSYINIFKAINQKMSYTRLELILKKPHFRPKKPKILLKKLNILLKNQRSYYWKPTKRIVKKLWLN